MPAISSGKILLTGANGFIATSAVKAFLDAGFSVRGTVRSPPKAEYLKTIFSSYGDRLEFAIVPDMAAAHAFDDAVIGVDAIVHTASPVHLNADKPEDIIDPAVNGTLSILHSATLPTQRLSVKRIVYLSSCATVLTRNAPEPRVYDESCWNDADVQEVEERDRDAGGLAKYSASKVLAERRAWEYYEEKKAVLPWDLVVVNPPWVFGPTLHEVGGEPESLNDSNRLLYNAITKAVFSVPSNCWVDVRDLAHSLVLAVMTPAAGGHRFIISQGAFKWEDFALAASKITPKAKAPGPSYDPTQVTHKIVYNSQKASDILGVTYRTLDDVTADIIKDWKSRGWL
ncbi:NAD-P-binding protein [Cubamyces sp. BRFM 1775]|nr:NAD-P-binding protein [Cubamyces sp. BRFM 1775]